MEKIHKKGAIKMNMENTFWKFVYNRQEIFWKKVNGDSFLTKDKILQYYKFTNIYRILDRNTQFLIFNIINNSNFKNKKDLFFNILLFKVFNRISTYEHFKNEFNILRWRDYSFKKYCKILEYLLLKNKKLFTGAYNINPAKEYGYNKTYKNQLKIVELIMIDKYRSIINCKSMEEGFNILKSIPGIGDFTALQYMIDFNYSHIFNFNENDFIIAGPGAKSGIKKIFKSFKDFNYEDIIINFVLNQELRFNLLNLNFKKIGDRNLSAVDIEHALCEFDKYTRLKYPKNELTKKVSVRGIYKPSLEKINYVFPKKWGIKF